MRSASVRSGRPIRPVLTAAAIALLLLSACARAASPTSGGSLTATVRIGPGDNGHQVTVQQGARVVITLPSTYWTVKDASDRSVLALLDQPTVTSSPGCVAGQGCGTVTAVFRALKAGTSVVTASRTSCGEAMRCTGGDGAFKVAVSVSA